MPRPDPAAPKLGQESMFSELEALAPKRTGQVLRGRHSVAIDKALTAAKEQGHLEDIDMAAATLVRAGGWALDEYEARNSPFGPPKIMREMTELLAAMHMTPDSRETDGMDDALLSLFEKMGGTDSDDAQVPDTAN